MKNYINKKETFKKIFIQDDFLSVFRSLLATPLFSIKNKIEYLNIEEKDVFGYDKLTIKSESLNLGMDLNLFIFIIKETNKKESNFLNIDINEFYDFIDLRKDNRSKATIERVSKSLSKLKTLNLGLEKKGNWMLSSFLNNAGIVDKNIVVEINETFNRIWNVERDQIYNINPKFINSLKFEYSKSLYNFYLCNNANDKNVFTIETLKKRLLCEEVSDKSFNANIRKAHNELKEKGFLKDFNELIFNRELQKVEISLNKDLRLKNIVIKDEEVKRKEKVLPEVLEFEETEEEKELRKELLEISKMERNDDNLDDIFTNSF